MKTKIQNIAAVVLITLGALAYGFGFGHYQWMAGGVEVNLYPAAALLLAGAVLLWRAWVKAVRIRS
jgi:hypothetical protein